MVKKRPSCTISCTRAFTSDYQINASAVFRLITIAYVCGDDEDGVDRRRVVIIINNNNNTIIIVVGSMSAAAQLNAYLMHALCAIIIITSWTNLCLIYMSTYFRRLICT